MAELRAALAATLAPLDGLKENAYLLSNPTPPTAEIEPGPIEYDLAMQRGWDNWQFTIRLFVGFTADIGAQKKLDSYIDPTGSGSVKALVEVDRTLGGICDHVQVTRCSGYRVYEQQRGLNTVLGAEWTVEVHVSN